MAHETFLLIRTSLFTHFH